MRKAQAGEVREVQVNPLFHSYGTTESSDENKKGANAGRQPGPVFCFRRK